MSQSRDSIENIWGDRTPYLGEDRWPERRDERTTEKPDRWVQSACVLCSNGCGCDIGVKDGRIVGVRGRTQDSTNSGRLGPKGLHGWEANNSPHRLTTPLIRSSNGNLEPASWDEAMRVLLKVVRDTRREAAGDQGEASPTKKAGEPGVRTPTISSSPARGAVAAKVCGSCRGEPL